MSPKSLFFLVVVGLCATQMVSAHREARGISDFFDTAKNKLANLLHNAEDSTRSSIDTVKGYVVKLENKLLESGTKALNSRGIQVNLNDLAALAKDNVKVCASNETVQAEAKAVLNDISSCITKDVQKLKDLINEMEEMWQTAKDMPSAIKDVASRCSSDEAVPEEPLQLNVALDTSDHELAEASNELLQAASKHVSRRALWDLSRMTRCAKTVFNFAKKDLVSIPGDIITVATHAFQLVQSVQGGIPACVAAKATANAPQIAKIALQVGTCVAAASVVNGEDFSNNEFLTALQRIANVAEGIGAIKSGPLNTVVDLLG